MWRRLLSLLSCAAAASRTSATTLRMDRASSTDPWHSATRIADSPQSPADVDRFGITMLNPSVDAVRDWYAAWEAPATLTRANQAVPHDALTYMKGTGTLHVGDGSMVFDGEAPRLYIGAAPAKRNVAGDEPAWMNTEFTAYGRVEAWGAEDAGFTLISRTNHDTSGRNPCDAHGYYARLVFSSGLVYIKKEFRHSNTDGVVYSKAVYSKDGRSKTTAVDFDYVNRFIGIKCIVRDNPDGRSVHLEVYLDLTEGRDGGDWQLAVEYDDYDLAATSDTGCQYSYTPEGLADDQCPVLRPGRVAILRSDKVNGLYWKWASVREIDPMPI